MRFRPLIGYSLILCAITIYGLVSVLFFYIGPTLTQFIIGGVVGILMGLFLGRRAFQDVSSLLIIEGQLSGKASYNLFGAFPYRLVMVIWIIYSNVVVFISPGSRVFVDILPMIDGLFQGGMFAYFIYFAAKAFLKEQALHSPITITVS